MSSRSHWSRRRIAALVVAAAGIALGAWLYTPDLNRSTVEARYLAAPGDLRLVDGVRLHVRDSGPRQAPVLVLLHGLGSHLQTWDHWVVALEHRFRVVRFDFPGHGLSGPDPRGDYRDPRTLALLTALLDTLGIEKATIVGNSMGGRIAWSFAAAHPERVERLVLAAPDGFASPGFAYDRPAEVPAVLGVMRYVLPRAVLRMNLAPAYADPRAMTDALAERYHDLMLVAGNREALLERMRQTMLTDPLPRLRSITAPTLLLWGDADAMIPVANAQDYLKAIPNAQLVTIPAVGHLVFEEAPTRSLTVLRSFLER